MFSFFKKKPALQPVPAWASFFDQQEYALFISELDKYFKSKNIGYQMDDGVIVATGGAFDGQSLGLNNIAQICKQRGKKEYATAIAGHFDSMQRDKAFRQEFDRMVANFEEVKQYIGVRLYANDYVAHIGKENTIGKDLAADIYAMLVFDLPDTISNVQPDQSKVWGKTLDELLEIGVQNIKANYDFPIKSFSMGEYNIQFVESDHFFAPNIVFDLEKHPGLLGIQGCLIGLPHRHAAIIYPINNLEVVKAINGMIPMVHGMHNEGPGSLSNNLYWYNDGAFTKMPYQIEGGRLQFFPPLNFVDMLNLLKE
jgi:hypothetical protein